MQRPSRHGYGPQDYDQYLALKVPGWAWLALTYLARPYVVVAMSLANRREPMALIETLYADRTLLMLDALAALPALAIVGAWLLRRPGARGLVRWIWHAGVVLFPLAALVATVASVLLVIQEFPRDVSAWHVLQSVVSAMILCYAVLSRRVHDTFRDFPCPPPASTQVRRRRRRRA